MPELPEVETVRRTLEPLLMGRRVESVQICDAAVLSGISADAWRERVVGGTFVATMRRGKYLGLELARRGVLVFHLRMTGRLVVQTAGEPVPKHLRLLFSLDNGTGLRFIDQRKFGRAYLVAGAGEFEELADVGPEPLSDAFSAEVLARALRGSRTTIKAALLDQKRIAGLGNIYADESLFRAGIHPERIAGELTAAETQRLWQGIRQALRDALANGGTTFRDYVDGNGRKGENQNYLLVYGRGGAPCHSCGETLVRTRVAGRGTVYCPNCQR